MPRYSYKCDECGAEDTLTCDRGEAPSELECECGSVLKRRIGASTATNIASKEKQGKEKKLKDNLRKREKKIQELDQREQEQFRQWSRRQTGGRW